MTEYTECAGRGTMQADELSLEELESIVLQESAYGNPDSSLQDWLSHGDLDGMTVQDVIDEWDNGRD